MCCIVEFIAGLEINFFTNGSTGATNFKKVGAPAKIKEHPPKIKDHHNYKLYINTFLLFKNNTNESTPTITGALHILWPGFEIWSPGSLSLLHPSLH